MKVNKDQLLKHKFWIMLIVAVPMILAGQFILLVLVAGEIDTDKKKLQQELDRAKKANKLAFNEANTAEKLAQAASLQRQENEVWAKVYARQADAMFWPKAIENTYPVHTGKFLREVKFEGGGGNDAHHLTGKLVNTTDILVQVDARGKREELYAMATEDMNLDNKKILGIANLPIGRDAQFTFQTGWYFNDKLTATQRSEYTASYHSQIRPILDIVDPVNEDGDGVVQLKDWPVPKLRSELPTADKRFLRFVQPPWKADEDISEEAWLAQEDLWIQKEIYRLIRQANDYVGKMEGKSVTGQNQVATFDNPYFELSLKLVAADKVEVKIKNLQSQRQKLDVVFKIRFTQDPSFPEERIPITHEPLNPLGSSGDSYTKVYDLQKGLTRTGIYSAEQVLTWETAAVRRIDVITIGSMAPEEIAHNHRSYPDNVKPLVPEPKKEVPVVDAVNPVPIPGGGRPRGLFPGGFGGPQMPGADDRGINGLIKKRYSEEPNEQTRRLPVAVSLIVYQNHIDRVLTSFSNSKLRFVMHQWLENRYPQSVRPQVLAQDPLNPGGVNPAMPFPRFGPGFRGGPGFPPFRGIPGGPQVPNAGQQTNDDEMEANVELVLYGTVTMYQRYPARNLPKLAPELKQ